MNLSSPEFKVGSLITTVALLVGGMSLKVTQGPGLLNTKSYWFEVNSASGLVKSSQVKMAGIPIGSVDRIILVKGKARVYAYIDDDVIVRTSSKVKILSDGILGDKHTEITPGNIADPELEPDSGLEVIVEVIPLKETLEQVGLAAKALQQAAQNINTSLEGKNPNSSLGRTLVNIEKLTEVLSKLTVKNEQKLQHILDRMVSIADHLDVLLDPTHPEGIRDSVQSVAGAIGKLDHSLENIKDITEKINSGEGTIGQLVNDDELIDNVNDAVTSLNEVLGGFDDFKTSVDSRGEFLQKDKHLRVHITARFQPAINRHYDFGIVYDRLGRESYKIIEETDQDGNSTTREEKVRTFHSVKITALMARRFHNLTLKVGLLEDAGGFALDYNLLDDDLVLSTEAFGLNRDEPNVRAFARYQLFNGFYLAAGGNKLNNPEKRSMFIGAGITVTNDDLKVFAGQLGTLAQ